MNTFQIKTDKCCTRDTGHKSPNTINTRYSATNHCDCGSELLYGHLADKATERQTTEWHTTGDNQLADKLWL